MKDYPSIQAAIDANPGREIFVPAGNHPVEVTLRITGEGTSLVGTGRILMTDPARHILEIEHARNVRIEGMTSQEVWDAEYTNNFSPRMESCGRRSRNA